jgi:superfamily I DNA/RNA helicase
MATPKLEGEAREAVIHRGGNVQIIASAGSGKTEVVAQRIVFLLEEGIDPEAIVSFTFTEKAAASLAARVQQRVSERLGDPALGKLGPLYIGTIHAYCFQLLQRFVARYETYDVLDENQLAAFLAREGRRLRIKQLDPKGRLFAGISTFLANAEVVENELLDPEQLTDPFRDIYKTYLERLDAFRVLSFGQLISHAIAELEKPEVREAVRAPLRHLIVDEYQDVNPAQEQLIGLLAGDGVELCVVGDDDQAIYQWRGTDVGNIIGFAERYPDTRTFTIAVNRRSRPAIVETANRCSAQGDAVAWAEALAAPLGRRGARRRTRAPLQPTSSATSTSCSSCSESATGTTTTTGPSRALGRSPAAPRSSPTSRRCATGPASTPSARARSSADRIAASGTTAGWRSTSRTTRWAHTRTSTVRTWFPSTPSS